MKIVIVFGEMGVGKSYRGKRLAKRLNYEFVEGDSLLPGHMAERVQNFKPLTKEMIEQFVRVFLFQGIIDAVWKAENDYKPGVVVSQALYLNQHRVDLKDLLENAGFEVSFVKICTPFLQNLKQLWSRPKGVRWVLYWLLNKPFFQDPTHPYTTASLDWLDG